MSNKPILTDAGWWKTVARMRGPCRACFHQESASEAKVELMVTNITEKSTAGTVGDWLYSFLLSSSTLLLQVFLSQCSFYAVPVSLDPCSAEDRLPRSIVDFWSFTAAVASKVEQKRSRQCPFWTREKHRLNLVSSFCVARLRRKLEKKAFTNSRLTSTTVNRVLFLNQPIKVPVPSNFVSRSTKPRFFFYIYIGQFASREQTIHSAQLSLSRSLSLALSFLTGCKWNVEVTIILIDYFLVRCVCCWLCYVHQMVASLCCALIWHVAYDLWWHLAVVWAFIIQATLSLSLSLSRFWLAVIKWIGEM